MTVRNIVKDDTISLGRIESDIVVIFNQQNIMHFFCIQRCVNDKRIMVLFIKKRVRVYSKEKSLKS
jgi:hypothetical protein